VYYDVSDISAPGESSCTDKNLDKAADVGAKQPFRVKKSAEPGYKYSKKIRNSTVVFVRRE